MARIVDVGVHRFGAEYVEVRAQKLFKTALTAEEDRVESAKHGVENGVALRVLVGGSWGFASVGALDAETLIEAVSDACRMAKAASSRLKTPIKLAQTKAVEDKITLKPRIDPASVPMEDKVKMALSVNNAIMAYDGRLKSCTTDYLDLTGTSFFMNNVGTYIEQDKIYVWARVAATASAEGIFTSSREEIGSTSGYGVFDVETPEKVSERSAKRAVQQLTAKPPKGGSFPVILGPNIVGVFAHEAFGHLAEADITLAGSVLLGKLGKKVASDIVTIYDDGTVEGAFGSYRYDDEGVPAQKTTLVKDGVFVGMMHDLETAGKLNAEPTGNARAEDFRVEPMIRMRNTFIEPRDCSFEELIEDLRFGYYLKAFRGGQANLDGTFQVGVQEAYEVVKGEIGEPIRDVSMSGNTLETLFKVDAVGKDFELSPGRCGKGQEAFVCDGGPHTRVKEVVIGGSA